MGLWMADGALTGLDAQWIVSKRLAVTADGVIPNMKPGAMPMEPYPGLHTLFIAHLELEIRVRIWRSGNSIVCHRISSAGG